MQTEDISANVLTDKIQKLHEIKDKLDRLSSTERELKEIYNTLEFDVIRIMEDLQLKNLKTDLGRVTLVEPALKAGFKEGMKDEAIKWLRENGQGHFVTEQVHKDNLNRIINDRVTAGESVPENLIGYTFIRKLQVRKA